MELGGRGLDSLPKGSVQQPDAAVKSEFHFIACTLFECFIATFDILLILN